MKPLDILYLVLLVVLLALSAIFSAADMAYSSVNKLRLERRAFVGDERSKKALHLAKDYDKTIATVLFGNDFVNILASSLASLLGADLLNESLGSTMAAMVSSLVLLVLLLIFGEITPKAVAKPHNYGFARAMVGFVDFVEILFFPFVYPTNKVAEWLTSPLIEKVPKENQLASDEELQAMVSTIEKEGIIDEDQSALLHRSIDFKETSCYEIMTPRVKVFAYDIETSFPVFLSSPEAFKHSRIPVYKGSLDHVLGYVSVKTLLRVLTRGEKPDLSNLLLPIVSVPRTMMISSAMALMKETHHHIAVVRDEYGGTEGIITLEDILEEVVGEMYDESDKIVPDIVMTKKKNVYLVKGKTNIDDLLDHFQLDPDSLPDDYSTVSGWINDRLGRFAKVGDSFSVAHLDVVVTKVSDYTVEECKITYHKKKGKQG
jgi:CBS domain containing-hemolysin-like protein